MDANQLGIHLRVLVSSVIIQNDVDDRASLNLPLHALAVKDVAKVLALTCSEPPANATHWTGWAVAKAAGISLRAVQRLEGLPTSAASLARFQEIQRSRLRRKSRGRGWALHGAAL